MRSLVIRISTVFLIVALIVSVGVIPTAPARAQDEKIVCDSDLIMGLYIAQNYFGLGAVLEGLAAAPAAEDLVVVDFSTLELGQYERLFTSIDPEDTIVEQATVDAIVQELAIPAADRMTAALDPNNPLQPALVTGEPPECSVLRFQLTFFYTLLAEVS